MPTPTILIGYGEFGFRIFRSLLAWSAAGGHVEWELVSAADTEAAPRRLKNLSLMWLEDDIGAKGQAFDVDREGGLDAPILRDFKDEIQRCTRKDFVRRSCDEAKRLLERGTGGGLGLDIVLLARPTERSVFGNLSELLRPLFEQLGEFPQLRWQSQAAHRLQAIQILDLGEFWSSPDPAMKEGLRAYTSDWEERYQRTDASFSRTFLIGEDADAHKNKPQHRIDEVVLFLEFQLFSGHRRQVLKRAFARDRKDEGPFGTFSIRLFEWNSGLIRRSAAARFGAGWMEHLLKPDPAAGGGMLNWARDLVRARNPGGGVSDAVSVPPVVGQALALPMGVPTWPDQVDDLIVAWRLTEREVEAAPELSGDDRNLTPVSDLLLQEITDGLHSEGSPIGLKPMQERVATLAKALSKTLEQSTRRREDGPGREDLRKLHRQYRSFVAGQIEIRGIRAWWPLYAVICAVGVIPLAQDALKGVPVPGTTTSGAWDRFLTALTEYSHALGAPHWSSVVSTLLCCFLAFRIGHRAVEPRAHRARSFWEHPTRGRLGWMVARMVSPPLGRRGAVDEAGFPVTSDTIELLDAAQRYGEPLARRVEEVRWLRGQLRSFLAERGLIGDGAAGSTVDPWQSTVRSSGGDQEEYDRLLAKRPPSSDYFRDAQRSLAVFAGWHRPYMDRFLRPLEFLDLLAGSWSGASTLQREEGPDSEGATVASFLRENLTADSPFFLRGSASYAPTFHVVLHSSLYRNQRVKAELEDAKIPGQLVSEAPSRDRTWVVSLRVALPLGVIAGADAQELP